MMTPKELNRYHWAVTETERLKARRTLAARDPAELARYNFEWARVMKILNSIKARLLKE